ncbi:MAG: PQQ-binding-like beta-propeller repeat protein [Planctomycetota bacterium]
MKPPIAFTKVILGAFMCGVGLLTVSIICLDLVRTANPARNTEASAPDFGVSTFGAPRVLDPATLGESWRQFRGPGSHGISERTDLPVEWSKDTNLFWETKLPGRGSSSPIAHFQRIYVTSTSGYGESFENRGEVRYLKHHVVCLDASTGKTIFRRDIQGSPLTQKLNHQLLQHGFASSSPASDGINVYAFFGTSGVYKFDSRGKFIWHADVGHEHSKYGSASSLVIHNDRLIVNASAESESVVALDAKTGRGLWRIDDVRESWSTPVIAKNQKGETELIIQDEGRVRGFSIESGTELWCYRGPEGYSASTPYVDNGICYFTAGPTRTLTAIKIGGSGDVTKSNHLWSVDNTSRFTSPMYLTGVVYVLGESGIFKCFDAKTGELINAKRIPTKQRIYGSPVLAGPYFYLPNGGNRFFVCRACTTLEFVRDNQLPTTSAVVASLCPSANSWLIRSDDQIQCIVRTKKPKRPPNLVTRTSVEPVEIKPRFEYDQNRLQPKMFSTFLSRDSGLQAKAIIKPIADRMSYSERLQACEWICKNNAPLTELRQQHRKAYWNYLTAGDQTVSELNRSLASIESETLETVKMLQRRAQQVLEKHSVALSSRSQ